MAQRWATRGVELSILLERYVMNSSALLKNLGLNP